MSIRFRFGEVLGFAAMVMAIAGLYALAIWWGPLNQDEGWYLYSAQLVQDGQKPFIDFAYTQGPVMSYVYARLLPMLPGSGVLQGRLLTALLGIVSLFLTVALAARIADTGDDLSIRKRRRHWAMVLVLPLAGMNIYQVYFTSVVKTYALAAVLVLCGLLMLLRSLRWAESGCRGALAIFGTSLAGGLCLAFAAGTRLSAVVILPAFWLVVLFWRLRGGPGHLRLNGVLSGMLLGGAIGGALVYLPYWIKVPDALLFGLLEYHGAREIGGLFQVLIYKIGFLLRLGSAYFPFLVIAAVGGGIWLLDRKLPSESSPARRGFVPLCLSVCAVTFVHLLTVFPYDDYQVFVMPVIIALCVYPIADVLARRVTTTSGRHVVMILILGLCLLHSLSSPMLQGWLLAERDRIWWPLKRETPLEQLRRVGRSVRAMYSSDDKPLLLTQDTYLAVEAGLRVPEGMELGPFCYYPNWRDERAKALNVMNTMRLREVIKHSDAPVAAISGYGFAIASPAVQPLPATDTAAWYQWLETYYRWVRDEPDFGQAATLLKIYERRTP